MHACTVPVLCNVSTADRLAWLGVMKSIHGSPTWSVKGIAGPGVFEKENILTEIFHD